MTAVLGIYLTFQVWQVQGYFSDLFLLKGKYQAFFPYSTTFSLCTHLILFLPRQCTLFNRIHIFLFGTIWITENHLCLSPDNQWFHRCPTLVKYNAGNLKRVTTHWGIPFRLHRKRFGVYLEIFGLIGVSFLSVIKMGSRNLEYPKTSSVWPYFITALYLYLVRMKSSAIVVYFFQPRNCITHLDNFLLRK